MKIGLSFVGISNGIGRDYTHCFPNISANLIEPYKLKNEVKIYTTTYIGDYSNDLLDKYKPILSTFIEFTGSHQVLTYIKSLEQLRNQDLDFIISTRFDIHFNKVISEIGLDYTKLNALFRERGWWDNMQFTTDNFFAFPYHMLEDFIIILQGLYQNPSRATQTDLHQAFSRLRNKIGIQNTHIVSNIDELSNYNIFFNLCNGKWGIAK